MNTELTKVEEFHKAVHHPIGVKPNIDDIEVFESRAKFMSKEVNNYLDACRNKDIVGVADAISDLLYFTYGTVLVHGLQDKMPEIFEEVHKSNMSKLTSNTGALFTPEGKVSRGPEYVAPQIKEILER